MGLFNQGYLKPGVYTNVNLTQAGATLASNVRIPVLIGEGEESFTYSNVELHRGSSSIADDLVNNEDISSQATGTNNTYQLTHYPVVLGDGKGTVTNDITKITVTSNDGTGPIPVTVTSLVGSTGVFTTQQLIPAGNTVLVTYYYKRTDTLISNENLSYQVPSFAKSTTIQPGITLSVTIPGSLGNDVTIAFTNSSTGVTDLLAVTGAGTNAISVELKKSDNTTVRTLQEIVTLIGAGIPTLYGGFLTATLTGTGSNTGVTATATALSGGIGQSTNTVFKVQNVPIVDGTNGGVTTTDPSSVTVVVNGVSAKVAAVNGAAGLITLTNPVAANSTLLVTYYTNTYQNTYDILPDENIQIISLVGLSPNRADYIEGTDYVLTGEKLNQITWGAAVNIAQGSLTSGYTPLGSSQITTTLKDEMVYLRPLTGNSNSINTVFTLGDVPTDGSGLSRPTDNPALVTVYVGTSPTVAFSAGAVTVLSVSGASAQVTLQTPPANGNNVYASYYRSLLNDHTFTITVASAGISGQGGFTVKDELGSVIPNAKVTASSVASSNFATTGIVWPFSKSDLAAAIGSIDETATLTFQDDSLTYVSTAAIQASTTIEGLNFVATTPGVGPNTITSITFSSKSGGVADNAALITGTSLPSWAATTSYSVGDQIKDANGKVQTVTAGSGNSGASTPTWATVSGNTTTDSGLTWTCGGVAAESVIVYITSTSGTRTLQEVLALFTSYPVSTTLAGTIIASAEVGTVLTNAATTQAETVLTGGAAAVNSPYANRFIVTSNKGNGSAGTGYVGQTYIDPVTALRLTLVDPTEALSYGYTQLPSPSYRYAPNDTITITVAAATAFVTGTSLVALPGITTTISSTYGTNVGDTALINTYNKAGNTPNVGEFYYLTYTVAKSDSDFDLQLFSKASDAYAAYGQPTAVNRLSLATQLLIQNGAQVFGCIQVKKVPGTNLAADATYISALDQLKPSLPGFSTHKVDVIVPLSTSASVQQALSRFTTTQSSLRQRGECIGFIGFNQYATVSSMVAAVNAVKNQRIIAVTPQLEGVQIVDPTSGLAQEYPVTGEFVAAALAGLNVNPANDVATTLTRQNVVGFTRALKVYDEATLDILASNGITVLVNNSGALQVRDYRSTDTSNPVVAEPYVTTSIDALVQALRADFDQFIGRKKTQSLLNDVGVVGNNRCKQFVASELLDTYLPCVVTNDASDPTTVDVQVTVKPIFCTKYINVNLTVTLNP